MFVSELTLNALGAFLGCVNAEFSTFLYMQFQLVRPLTPGSARDIDGRRRRVTEVVLILVLILIEILFLPAEVGGTRLKPVGVRKQPWGGVAFGSVWSPGPISSRVESPSRTMV
jgi:hypothetical protein